VRETGQGLLRFGSVFRGFRKFYVQGACNQFQALGRSVIKSIVSKTQIAGYETWEKLVL
jgi:hypothetical protein